MIKPLSAVICIAIAGAALQATAEIKSSVTIASPWEVASYDPAIAGFAIQKLQIMENLVDADVNGALHPGLATAWTASKDGLFWQFTLRSGVKFHDGSDFTAEATVTALTRAWKQPGVLKKAPIIGISASGEAVVITLEKPFTALPAFLAHATTIIPAPAAFDADGYSHLQHVDTIETSAVPIPRVVALKVNAGHPFFSDAKARQALSLAIPRDGIARAITCFPEAAADQLFPPALNTWHSADLEPLQTDIEAANSLLSELGWVAGPDGILTRDGERFSITLRTFPDRPELPLIATALQDQWREIGIELEVSVANYSEIPAGHQDGSLHVALYARNYGLTPDPIGSVLQDFGAGGGDWGAMGWHNQKVVEALDIIASTADPDKRQANIATVAKELHQDLPVIPVVWYQHTVSIDKNLKGVIIDPLQRSYGLSDMYWAN